MQFKQLSITPPPIHTLFFEIVESLKKTDAKYFLEQKGPLTRLHIGGSLTQLNLRIRDIKSSGLDIWLSTGSVCITQSPSQKASVIIKHQEEQHLNPSDIAIFGDSAQFEEIISEDETFTFLGNDTSMLLLNETNRFFVGREEDFGIKKKKDISCKFGEHDKGTLKFIKSLEASSKPPQYYAFDIDGTLTPKKGQVSEDVKKTLLELIGKHRHIHLITGRSTSDIHSVFTDINRFYDSIAYNQRHLFKIFCNNGSCPMPLQNSRPAKTI